MSFYQEYDTGCTHQLQLQ